MKRKLTAVLLCVALLLTLSVNVSAEGSKIDADVLATDTQETPITEKVVMNIDENNVEIIENENLGDNTAVPLSQNAAIISGSSPLLNPTWPLIYRMAIRTQQTDRT